MHNLMTITMRFTQDDPLSVMEEIKRGGFIKFDMDEDEECVVVTVINVSDVTIYSPDD